jgi:stalled ribosome rescue protein Dom34
MEESMKKEVGLWLDHRKAVIVTLENGTEAIREIQSNMEKHVRFSSSTHLKDHIDTQGPEAEDMRDRQYKAHLDRYYDKVLSSIVNANSIFIFGPGEAKIELENHLERHGFGEHVVGVESADKMTDRQIAAKVRNYFQNK